MPTIDVREDWSKRLATIEVPNGWSATRFFTVAYCADEGQAKNADGIPRINDTHPLTTLMLASRVQARCVSPNFWTVQVDYKQVQSPNQNNTDPLNQPSRMKWKVGTKSEKIDHDVFGNPIVNTAQGKFGSPPSREFGTMFLTITRNEPYFDIKKALAYQNKVNKTIFAPLGQPAALPGQCMCRTITPTQEFTRGAKYVNVSYEFEFRPGASPTPDPNDGLYDGFKLVILNQGKAGWYKDTTTNKAALGAFVDKKGNRLEDDVLLDRQGIPIIPNSGDPASVGIMNYDAPVKPFTPIRCPAVTPREVYVESATGSSYVIKYSIYQTADFNTLAFR